MYRSYQLLSRDTYALCLIALWGNGGHVWAQAQQVLPDRIWQTATEMDGGVSGNQPRRFDLHATEERPDGLHRDAILQGHTRQPRETVV